MITKSMIKRLKLATCQNNQIPKSLEKSLEISIISHFFRQSRPLVVLCRLQYSAMKLQRGAGLSNSLHITFSTDSLRSTSRDLPEPVTQCHNSILRHERRQIHWFTGLSS
mmetsp:Transcript_26265/g.54406  ORF Transcript_26265/g.54406 Transcript_26265/m.54406 type:complete len:110 (+) Transcript_26265:135-464(+)